MNNKPDFRFIGQPVRRAEDERLITGKGRFNMLQSDRASVDGGTWIKVQNEVTVGANETKVVPFTITVPRDASPGDHPAGIAARVDPGAIRQARDVAAAEHAVPPHGPRLRRAGGRSRVRLPSCRAVGAADP